MVDKKKKKSNSIPNLQSIATMATRVANEVQLLGKAIPNPFRTTNAPREESNSGKLQRPNASPSCMRTARLPVKLTGQDACQLKKKSRETSKKKRKSRKSTKIRKFKSLDVAAQQPIARKLNSHDLKKNSKSSDPDQKLREELADLTNELTRLENFDQSKELFDSMKLAWDELHFFDQIYKGAKHAVRNQFKNLADEIQDDKEFIWTQMMDLETTVGRAMEEQKLLEKELDSILIELQELEQLAQKEESKGGGNVIVTFLFVGVFITLLAFIIYRK